MRQKCIETFSETKTRLDGESPKTKRTRESWSKTRTFLAKTAGSGSEFRIEKLRLKSEKLNQQKEERQQKLQMIAHQQQLFAAVMQQMNQVQAAA